MKTKTGTKITTKTKIVLALAAGVIALAAAGGYMYSSQWPTKTSREIWCLRHPKSAFCKVIAPGYIPAGYNQFPRVNNQ